MFDAGTFSTTFNKLSKYSDTINGETSARDLVILDATRWQTILECLFNIPRAQSIPGRLSGNFSTIIPFLSK